ncbi:hypothetical protein DFH08DRAFT_720040 [Mycena albidolilacea]|uniref:DUF7223 domain-containing protein n=1 Tax=Mycena albidolilacea TaxID=1033008 RepID=A0AAD6Z5X9_9AGAR|nr:hypothetical protein DFH08DRAFT_720040 [Mycena albidolilacea]
MLSSFLVIFPFIAGINALNDWTVACTRGECSYGAEPQADLPQWGSNNAITDITKAADWQILGCDPNALAQDIRLVCLKDPDDPNSQCPHLYQEIGAVNKIVRLPEDCGASAFARVAKSWVSEDQSIPSSVRRSLVRRDGKVPVVKSLSLDTDFDAVDWSKTGPVNIAIQGVNVPGVQAGDIQVTSSRRRTINPRFSIKGALGGMFLFYSFLIVTRITLPLAVKDAVVDNSIDANKTFDLKPLTFSKHVNLINSQLDCGKLSASLQVDMDANSNAQASISVAATGTIIPPKITKFGVVAALTANVAGTMTMNADITGHVDSGKIELVNLGVPAFDLPGIFTLGPSFTVSAQVVGDVDVVMDMQVGLNFDINNAQLTFPPDASNKPLSSAFSINDTPLTLNAAGDVTATGTLTAHLIPSLNFGVSVLGGKAKADIFLDLDTNAVLQMNLDGSVSATKVVTPPTIDNSASSSPETTSADATSTAADIASPNDDSSSDAGGSTDLFQTDDETTKSLGGCINVNGGISINAGAEGSFFGLFDKVSNARLFEKNFKIFNKCFGDQATAAPATTPVCFAFWIA